MKRAYHFYAHPLKKFKIAQQHNTWTRGSHLSPCTKISILHSFPQIFNKHLLCAAGKETKVSRVSFQVSEAQGANRSMADFSIVEHGKS